MKKRNLVSLSLAALVVLSAWLGAATLSPRVALAGCTYTCYCGDDPMSCQCAEDSADWSCACGDPYGTYTCACNDCGDDCDACCNGADCDGSCVPDPTCGDDCDACCNGADCDGSCVPDPSCDPDLCGSTPEPEAAGDWHCCAGNSVTDSGAAWCDYTTGSTCMQRSVCNPSGNNEKTPGGVCDGTDEVCAVAIVNSCIPDSDPEHPRYSCDSDGPGDTTTCNYEFDYEGTLGCDDVVRPPGGGTATVTDVFEGVVTCPPITEYEAAGTIAVAEALASAGHPPDTDGDGICDCDVGTDVCCPEGTTLNPTTETCDPDDLCENIEGEQTTVPSGMSRLETDPGVWFCQCGDTYTQCGEVCKPEGECCDPDNFHYCPILDECLPNGTCCTPGYEPCPDCRPAEECIDTCLGRVAGAEYCAEVVTAAGVVTEPWATKYPTEAALGGFFAQRAPSAQTFSQASSSQALARKDGNPTTLAYPLVGRVITAVGAGSCQAQICDHGQECQLQVRAGGRTSATCADTICDVCDPAAACYDAAKCGCDPLVDPLTCCQADPTKPNYNPSCVLPPRGVAIEVVPNLIGRGDSCIVYWATQGMASTTVVGDGFQSGDNLALRHLRSGAAEVADVQTSTLFKIVGLGVDGQTYEATDLCATSPVIGEF